MYDSSDPRSRLGTAGSAPSSAATQGFAAAEYVRFHGTPPQEESAGARTWLGRGQNFVVAYSEVRKEAVLAREAQPDEYLVLLPDAHTVASLTTETESRRVPGHSLVIMPPGRSAVALSSGRVVRVFSAACTDLAERAANAAAYRIAHPHIPPFRPWPAPPAGYRIRFYDLDVPPQEGRFGRIWRSSNLMINVLPLEHGPRDVTKLSPHHHADFEQCSLALEGAFVHHIRWPWTADSRHWRPDEHEWCAAPSMTVIPPPAIHTSAATEPGTNQLVDIFAPPRMDFSKMPGWVLNADEYPMP